MYRPLVPLYLESLGASPLDVGLVISAYSLLPALLSLSASRVISSLTIQHLLGMGSLMVAAGCLSMALSTSLPVLFVGQMIGGASSVLVVVAAQSYVQQISSPQALVRNFSLLVGTFSLADVIGPTVGGSLARGIGFQPTFLVTACVAVAALAMSRRLGRDRLQQTAAEPVTWSLVKDVVSSPHYRLSLALTVSGIVILTLNLSFYPLYLSTLGFSPQTVGIILSFRGVGQVLAPVVMGPLERAVGRVRIMTGALVAGAAMLVLIPFTSGLPAFIGLSVVLGCSFGLIIPLSLVLASEGTRPSRKIMALSLRFAFNRATDTAGPVIFGAAVEAWGYAAPFRLAGAYLAGTLAYALRRRRLVESRPEDKSAQYGG